MRARLLVAAALALTVSGTDAASAFLSATTIDRHFEIGTARVCAVAETRSADRVTACSIPTA
jgi:hypothetical protein